jgi:hypothetical protein
VTLNWVDHVDCCSRTSPARRVKFYMRLINGVEIAMLVWLPLGAMIDLFSQINAALEKAAFAHYAQSGSMKAL